MEKKGSLSTLLFGIALLLFVFATFAMFGKTISYAGATFPNMFQSAFGEMDGQRLKGMTAVFVFQTIILVLAVAIIVGTVTRKFHYILTLVLYGLVCLCSFIAFILSFNALNFYVGVHGPQGPGYALGAGPIIYSIMHILGLLASAVGLALSRKGQ